MGERELMRVISCELDLCLSSQLGETGATAAGGYQCLSQGGKGAGHS